MHDYSKLSGKRRLRFRDWLVEKLNSGEIKGVSWIDRSKGLFKIPWKHGSRHNWTITDVDIFREWAKYSGKFKEGKDRPDPIKWKTNFRCTLNALPDFKEVREESCPRGPRGYKIYMMKSGCKEEKEQSACQKGSKQASGPEEYAAEMEIIRLVDELMAPSPEQQVLQKPVLVQPRPNSASPAFESLVISRSQTLSFPSPYTSWYLAAWNAMAVDQHVERPDEEKGVDESDGESASEEAEESSQ